MSDMKSPTLHHQNAICALQNSLPHEIFAHIFSLTCPPIDFSKEMLRETDDFFGDISDNGPSYELKNGANPDLLCTPLILSAVCSRWREVALSSPRLWSTFAVEGYSRKLKAQVPLLRFYLTNTGPLPFSLDLDLQHQQMMYFDKYGQQAPIVEWQELQPLANVIFNEFPEKIRTLRVVGAPPGWMCFLSQKKLPNLQELVFTWGGDLGDSTTLTIKEDTFVVFPGDPVYLCKPSPVFSFAPGLPPLTTLHLRNVYIDVCAKVLFSCPHLIEYHCYRPTTPPSDFMTEPPLGLTPPLPRPVTLKAPFVLPNLKRFGWVSTEESDWESTLLKNIRLPNIEELQWGKYPEYITTEELNISSYFSSYLLNALPSFTFYGYRLELSYEEEGNYWSRELGLPHLSNVRSLGFHNCSGKFAKSILRFLSVRILGEPPSFLLPRLNKISLVRCGEDEEDVGKALAEMLEKRSPSLGTSLFTFEAVDCKVILGSDTKFRLGNLAGEISLKIL